MAFMKKKSQLTHIIIVENVTFPNHKNGQMVLWTKIGFIAIVHRKIVRWRFFKNDKNWTLSTFCRKMV